MGRMIKEMVVQDCPIRNVLALCSQQRYRTTRDALRAV